MTIAKNTSKRDTLSNAALTFLIQSVSVVFPRTELAIVRSLFSMA